MKRLDNLYDKICNIDNINHIYNQICKKINNKAKLEHLKEYHCFYISKIYSILKSETYSVSPYHIFTIYEPKKRRIVSLSLQDKIINHLVSTYIILPAIFPCLIDANVASRVGLGSKKGLELSNNFHKTCSIKFSNYYILKCDISKFFQSIDPTGSQPLQQCPNFLIGFLSSLLNTLLYLLCYFQILYTFCYL